MPKKVNISDEVQTKELTECMIKPQCNTVTSTDILTSITTEQPKRSTLQNTVPLLLYCPSSLLFETFLLVLPSDTFKVTAGLHLASHLFPGIPWGVLSSPLLGPVLYCPHSSSLGKCLTRHNSFPVILQVLDTFLQLFSLWLTDNLTTEAHLTGCNVLHQVYLCSPNSLILQSVQHMTLLILRPLHNESPYQEKKNKTSLSATRVVSLLQDGCNR